MICIAAISSLLAYHLTSPIRIPHWKPQATWCWWYWYCWCWCSSFDVDDSNDIFKYFTWPHFIKTDKKNICLCSLWLLCLCVSVPVFHSTDTDQLSSGEGHGGRRGPEDRGKTSCKDQHQEKTRNQGRCGQTDELERNNKQTFTINWIKWCWVMLVECNYFLQQQTEGGFCCHKWGNYQLTSTWASLALKRFICKLHRLLLSPQFINTIFS